MPNRSRIRGTRANGTRETDGTGAHVENEANAALMAVG